MARRDFGTVRKLSSGRWQTRYSDPTGRRYARTFGTKADANRFLAGARATLTAVIGLVRRRARFAVDVRVLIAYARRVRGRPLAPRTRERYDGVLRTHIAPPSAKSSTAHRARGRARLVRRPYKV